MKYLQLREKYDKFIYKDYKIEEDEENIYLKYFFEIENLTTFEPEIKICKKKLEIFDLYGDVAQNAVFNIGMIEAISYFKATCSKVFLVKCGKLNDSQVKWYKKLIYLGLGEFRYINKINISEDEFVDIISEGKRFEVCKLNYDLADVVIPVGGGKDSNVSLELLKKLNCQRYAFRINMEDVSQKCIELAGIEDENVIEIKRKIDPNLIKLNEQGFLNGHTPFSSLVAFLTYFVSVIFGKKYIALSNEDSANESNVEGENINHQYSKTFEFENDFRKYVKENICTNGPEYFSFLRPISEIQIAKLFSKLEKYHTVFKSCNVGSKSKPWRWCCDCPKCLFAFVILSPFLYKEKLVKIFGEDLFEKEKLKQTFIELCGYGSQKPFECVGTYKEVRFAVSETIKELKKKKQNLPVLLKYFNENFETVEFDILNYYSNENNLPKEFDEILKGEIYS